MSKLHPLVRDDLIKTLGHILDRLQFGCGNHGCNIKPPTGMGTNCVCKCTSQEFARRLLNLAVFVETNQPLEF